MKYTLLLHSVIWLFIGSQSVRADDRDPTPFAKDYIVVNFNRNFPQGEMKKRFLPGSIMPAIGYRHTIDTSWLMGLGFQYKSSLRIDADTPTSKSSTMDLLTFYHESLYALRIFHPVYLLFGPRILYLMPSQGARLPVVKDSTEQVEIGAGLTLSLLYFLSQRTYLNLGGEIWRGTKTSRLHGVELSAGFGWSV